MSNFYDAFSGEKSQGSFNYRSDKESNNLPGLAYVQGHSARNIHMPRAMIPMIGRDGYKLNLVYRVNDGSARNRTITQQDDLFVREYFVETDRIQRPRFKVTPDQNTVLTTENYEEYVNGAVLPNGEKVEITASTKPLFDLLIQDIINNGWDQYQKIPLIHSFYRTIFGPVHFVYLEFKGTQPTYDVMFPDGGIQQVPNFRILTQVYGDNGEYDKLTPYTDLMKFDPVVFVSGDAPPGMFPDVTPSSSYIQNIRT